MRLQDRTRGVVKKFLTASTVVAVVTVGIVAVSFPASAVPAPPTQRTASGVTADSLPTVQIDGVVWNQAVVGNTVWAGGSFSKARPAGSAPGVNTVTRNNLLAFDITTGNLISSIVPNLNGEVKAVAVSPDGSRVYVGGAFTSANGQNHYRVAAYDAASGAIVANFTGGVNAEVNAIVATNTAVYVGGAFSNANGSARGKFAAFNLNGTLLGWAPSAGNNEVQTMVMSPDQTRLIAGGSFTTVNGSASAYGLASLDPNTGALYSWAASSVVKDAGPSAAILKLTTDGTNVYGNGYVYGSGGNLEGAFAADPTTGTLKWIEDCHGDTYSNFGVNGAVYTVGHAHDCAHVGGYPETNPRSFQHAVAFTAQATGTLLTNTSNGYANFGGQPSPSMINWFPVLTEGSYTGQSQAAWSVGGNANYIVLGGEFPTVNGLGQQGLVRFATPPGAPKKQGPMLSGAAYKTAETSTSSSTMNVTWSANWDRDDENLTYKLVRDGDTNNPIFTTTLVSQFWNRPQMSFTDTGLAAGSTHQYRVFVNDPDGNLVAGDATSGTVSTAPGNKPPTAAFTSTATNLSVAFDGTGSSDADGTISSYAWTFGDNTTGTGAKPSHTYAAAGTYNVTLKVTDNQGATGTVVHTVSPGVVANKPPVASFTASSSNLTATFNAAGSSDPDGTISSYAWTFGDSTTGSGVNPTHTYAAAGTYSVQLTVTDNQGATGSSTAAVTVTAASALVSDTFTRTVDSGLGTANVGGTWSTFGPASSFSANGSTGQITMTGPGDGPYAVLGSVSQSDLNLTVDSTMTKAPTGNGAFMSILLRDKNSGATDYRLKLRYMADGSIHLVVSKVVNFGETYLTEVAVPGLTFNVGDTLRTRAVISGTGTTSISGKVWKVGATEPVGNHVSVTDTQAELQSAGAVGIQAYLSGSSTNAPVGMVIDNLSATAN